MIDNNEDLYQKNEHVFCISDRVQNDIFNNSNNAFNNINTKTISLHEKEKEIIKSVLHKIRSTWQFYLMIRKSNKVIFHSLPPVSIQVLMKILPNDKRKIHWAIFGGDLYQYEDRNRNMNSKIKEYIRKVFIKKIDYVHTTMEYNQLKQWYKTSAKLSPGSYPLLVDFSVLNELKNARKNNHITKIMVGNSACPTNNHIEIFNKLSEIKHKNFEVIVPLSYSVTDKGYFNHVINEGEKMLGEKFIPIFEYMNPEEYLEFINQIDIVIMNHKRQRALGILLPLIYLGKKVYLNSYTSIGKYLTEDMGCILYKTEDIQINNLDNLFVVEPEVEILNAKKMKSAFSEERFISGWKKAFQN